MKDKIEQKLKKIEGDLKVYFDYINDKNVAAKDRSVVSFKFINEMMAFEALRSLVPDYKIELNTGVILAQGLGGVAGYVDIVDGAVVISPSYDAMLNNKEEYMKRKIEEAKAQA